MRLIIFDVDGTLVDSQGDIMGAMVQAFEAEGLTPPNREAVLGIVGLSLDVAISRLAPEQPEPRVSRMVQGYKDAYMDMRKQIGAAQSSPLYPGALDTLHALAARPDLLLGVATGKSKRGLDKLIEAHSLEGMFVTEQVADFHPSKPHPSMIMTALQDADVGRQDAVMIGDTSFDMDMGRAAGVKTIAVSWGYHPVEQLEADHMIHEFGALPGLIDHIWGPRNG